MTARDDFFSAKVVQKSRKAYTCSLCHREIPAASRYVSVSGCSNNVVYGQKLHEGCALEAGLTPSTAAKEGEAS